MAAQSDLPQDVITAAEFAQSLADRYTESGGSLRDLFSAFAGLVSRRDAAVATDCLRALDEGMSAQPNPPPPPDHGSIIPKNL